jgi:hypothetical protein
VAADRVPEQLGRLAVAVDDLLGRQRPGVDEGVDVDDQVPPRLP